MIRETSTPGNSRSTKGLTISRHWEVSLHKAVLAAGGRVRPALETGSFDVSLPGLLGTITSRLSLDMADLVWRFPLRPRIGCHPTAIHGLLVDHASLPLVRFGLHQGEFCLLAETPLLTDEQVLIKVVHLLREDFLRGLLLWRQATGNKKVRTPEERERASLADGYPAMAHETITSWLREEGQTWWQTDPQGEEAWRLLRGPSAPTGFPALCQLRLTSRTLEVSTTVLLQGPLSPESREALAGFLSRRNGHRAVKFALVDEGLPSVKLIATLPLPGLTTGQIGRAVAYLAEAFRFCSLEMEALMDIFLAQEYLRIFPCWG